MAEEAGESEPMTDDLKAMREVAEKPPTTNVEHLYMLADLLSDTDRLVDGTFGHPGLHRDLPPERADALEKMLAGADFFRMSRDVRAYADAWQCELDRSEG